MKTQRDTKCEKIKDLKLIGVLDWTEITETRGDENLKILFKIF